MLALKSRHIYCGHLVAIFYAKHMEADCSRSCKQILGVFGDIDGTAGFLDLENADALALLGTEHADSAVIGAGKE